MLHPPLYHSPIQKPCQSGSQKLAGARRVSAERPYSHVSQPISRVLDGMRKCVRMRDGHSSGTPIARRLKQPTRTAGSGPIPKLALAHGFAPSLFGLAPDGVCPAADVAAGAVRSYRTISPLPQLIEHAVAVCFLWHCPWVRTRRMLSGTACPWSPDFSSPATFRFRRSGRPTD